MSTLQNTTKSVVRVGKNYIKGYSDVQIKVRDATSNDPWGPSGAQMNELAQLSYNQNDFIEMMELLDKRLNDKGKNWRHVFKALTVLDYLIHAGSENVIIYFRDNLYLVKTLKEFQHIDDYGKDQGANVRQKAKDITNLLQDEGRLREERRSRANMRDRMGGGSGQNDDEERERRRRQQQQQPRRNNKEDEELKRAIEESKRMAREQEERIRAETKDEEELQKALALSKAEEEKRIRELEMANQTALFDDSTNLDGNNVYNNQQVDFFGNPLGNVQPQYTSFNPYLQAQQTGYNPFLAQQMQQQQMMQQQYMQQQAEYQRQLEMQAAAQQYQQMMTQQPIQPQPTAFGSNNPFAFGGSGPSTQQQQPHNVPVGNLFSVDENPSPAPQPQPQPPPPQPVQQTQQQPPRVKVNNDDRFAELNRMLASGDGVDTFGNVGEQRFGHSQGRVRAQQTGANGVGPQPTGTNPFFAI
ncbi:hypothetical protein OC846_003365 [Tilletia horrida]|uniref:ENTH domain-containing protein n=1 Tax=Tilletia horrida TaxID=155126 RepID=A0AAN6JTZ8_9BASI|nr:hypothetical protein OC846_003365 [Tilletia horrida]KAK0563638.1 hypothetical protein OC861_004703 [Tilletia horrida]